MPSKGNRHKMNSRLDRKPENWLKNENKLFSENDSGRLQWLIDLTPRSRDWIFPGGSTTISLFEACSYCYINGQFLAAMILGLSFVEHTLISLFKASGRKGIDHMDIDSLGQEALSYGLITEDIYNNIVDAGIKRNAILPFRRAVGVDSVKYNFKIPRQIESSGYEAEAKQMMIAVAHFLDRDSI